MQGVAFLCPTENIPTFSWGIEKVHCMKKRIFVLRKFVKSGEKIIFSFVFVCFRFTEIFFLSFPSNENVRKQHLSANAYLCVNMEFSYMIAGRKVKISSLRPAIIYENSIYDNSIYVCRIVTKTSDFFLVFRSTFCWPYLS